jgi:PilX N-terminal
MDEWIMQCVGKETGMAFIVTTGLLFLITLLGFAAFRWSIDEIGIASNQRASVQAQYIAESGAAVMLQWFQEPKTFPAIGAFPLGEPEEGAGNFLARRMTDSRGAASFFNDKGQSQFLGTADVPDFWYQSDLESPDGFGDAFAGLGVLSSLKLYRPATLGAIGTVEATGTTGSGISRTASVEMIPSPVPPTSAAVQIGPGTDGLLPILIHWGDLRVLGDADLGSSLESIPKKESDAPVDSLPYSSYGRQDAWLDFYVGGSIVDPTTACMDCTEPFLSDGYGHLHQFQGIHHPDFGLDRWDYHRLKNFAKDWGVYFGTDRDGFVYEDGVIDPVRRMTPLQALGPETIGIRRGLIFIDTVDQRPPDGTNLAMLDLPVDYLEGIFSIQAHLTIRESGSGRSMEVRAPSVEGSDDPSPRQTVVLSNIHLKGILSVAGRLTVEGRPSVFGALVAQQGFSGTGQPEVWYDADLRTGYYPGLPTVTFLKGSWYLR